MLSLSIANVAELPETHAVLLKAYRRDTKYTVIVNKHNIKNE